MHLSRTTVVLVLTILVALSGVSTGIAASTSGESTATVVARYPADGDMVETTVVTLDEIATVGPPQTQSGRWTVPITLTEPGAQSFAETVNEAGFTSEDGVANCPTERPERNDGGYCLLTVLDGEVIFAAAMSPSLADSVRRGDFVKNPQFVLVAPDEETAKELALAFDPSTNGQRDASGTEQQSNDATAQAAEDGTQTAVPGFGVGAAILAAGLAGALSRQRLK